MRLKMLSALLSGFDIHLAVMHYIQNRPPPSHRNVFVCALSLFWFGVLQAQIFEIALENVWLTVNSA